MNGVSTLPAPAVYDVHEGFFNHPHAFTDAYTAWLEAYGVDKNDTYRTEHHVIDVPLVRVFQFAHNENGERYVDPATNEHVERPPFDVLIRTPAPKPEEFE